jgi:hypothetical protein
VAFFALGFSLLAITGGSELVLLFTAAGGLSGFAALLSVLVTRRANKAKAIVEDKSVAILELEKAVPGLGEIIKVWQDALHRVQDELVQTRAELAECRMRVEELECKESGDCP